MTLESPNVAFIKYYLSRIINTENSPRRRSNRLKRSMEWVFLSGNRIRAGSSIPLLCVMGLLQLLPMVSEFLWTSFSLFYFQNGSMYCFYSVWGIIQCRRLSQQEPGCYLVKFSVCIPRI